MKNIGLLVLFLLLVGNILAQGKLTDEKRKEFEAQKVAFYTKELDLSPDEAARFWPLYNEMRKKIESVECEMRKKGMALRNAKGVTEEVYRNTVNEVLASEQKVLDLKNNYYQKMLQALPASKIWKLGQAERKFHRQLFDKLRRESSPKK